MDIGSGKVVEQREEEGTVILIRDEAGERMYHEKDPTKPVSITVVGTYSATYRRASEAQRDRNIKRRNFHLDGDQLDQQALELVAACITAWDGFTANGEAYPLTKPNAVQLLRAFPWIRQQVEAAMNDHSLFFRAPSPSSVSA